MHAHNYATYLCFHERVSRVSRYLKNFPLSVIIIKKTNY